MTRYLLAAATAVALAVPAAPASAASCPETVRDCVWQAGCGSGCGGGEPIICFYSGTPPVKQVCISI